MNGSAFCHLDSLKIKIEHIVKYCDGSTNCQSREILQLLLKHVVSFEEISKKTLDTDLDVAICSEVDELRGIVDEIISKSETDDYEVEFSTDEVENLMQKMESFNLRLKMEEQRCSDGLYKSIVENEDEDDEEEEGVSSNMIGACDVYEEVKDKIMSGQVISSLVGMAGIGKTTLVKKVFQDPAIVERFDHRVWVRVGKKCRVEDIPRRILAEVDPDSLQMLPEDAVDEYLKGRLKSKRYLIILEDVWDRFMVYLLHPADYRYHPANEDHPFLYPESRSQILLTSRLQQLNARRYQVRGVTTMRLLNEEESWSLLCDKVFCNAVSSCPPQLQKAGKKIAKNCDGLPLTILAVARLLSNEEKTLEFWNEVAAKRNHQLFLDAYTEISKVLLPSYTYIPRLLQMCFLFIGLFPQNQEVTRSKLINLLLAHRFWN